MHLRGKAFRYEVKYPDGTREVLLDVPEYDFIAERLASFRIPPGDPDYVVKSKHKFRRPLLLQSLMPHMHLEDQLIPKGAKLVFQVHYTPAPSG